MLVVFLKNMECVTGNLRKGPCGLGCLQTDGMCPEGTSPCCLNSLVFTQFLAFKSILAAPCLQLPHVSVLAVVCFSPVLFEF